MNGHENNWPAGRVVHLVGGCKAINEPGPCVKLIPRATNTNLLQFQLPGYGALYSELDFKFATIEFPIIGVDFYSHAIALDGLTPEDWRPFHKTGESAWYCEDVIQTWAGISHHAHEKKNGRLWDLTSRIKHQLRVCSWRLRQISIAYEEQLFASLKRSDFEEGKLFEDGFTWLAYLSIQAFLIDACVLRDYLAEFAYYFIFQPKYNLTKTVATMARLKSEVLDKDKIEAPETIIDYLRKASGDQGWIKRLGDYRNLIIHSAPLARAEKHLFAAFRSLKFNGSENIPAISCPTPEYPAEIRSARKQSDYFSNFENQIKVYWEAARGEIQSIDGLEYAHWVTGGLSEISDLLAGESPLPPKRMVFDETNIIGPVTVRQI